MFGNTKHTARRAEIRRTRQEAERSTISQLKAKGAVPSIIIAVVFWMVASSMLVLRDEVVQYRPGQWTRHDIVARVDFSYQDEKQLTAERAKARLAAPHVYRVADPDIWKQAEDDLLALPDKVKGAALAELPADLKPVLDAAALSKLQDYSTPPDREHYAKSVRDYIAAVRALNLVILPDTQRAAEEGRIIQLENSSTPIRGDAVFTPADHDNIAARLNGVAQAHFTLVLQPKIVALTVRRIGPTFEIDDVATTEVANRMVDLVPYNSGEVVKKANMTIVDVPPGGGEIKQEDYQVLKAENQAYLDSLGVARWGQRTGVITLTALMTLVVSLYVGRYQPRVITNFARALAIGALLLAMLLLSQLAALGTSTIYFFGIAPTILVAMILCIAYEQRFALGIAMFHAVLVTLALNEDVCFLAIASAGIVTCCFMLDLLRTRSRLIEIGAATGLAMIVATSAAGLLHFDPMRYIAVCAGMTFLAGFLTSFFVLGILPFIEKAFRITTSLTLLELADASQPLLRRLAVEAPGTYNHSLQVATLAEAAAESIGANSLLCRVAAYYHDVGKINKADYFVENQVDGQNRHLNLSPSVSLLIIIGHVKDGLELAREYNLPTSLFPFIQQHHGTTLVEFFYHRACDTCTPDQPLVSETQYRYPGPKPKSKEIAILMLADASESACRSISEPNATRLEAMVHDITLKRLHDSQFDECELTLRELNIIEKTLVKTLLSIYHGRIAYPSTAGLAASSAPTAPSSTSQSSARTA